MFRVIRNSWNNICGRFRHNKKLWNRKNQTEAVIEGFARHSTRLRLKRYCLGIENPRWTWTTLERWLFCGECFWCELFIVERLFWLEFWGKKLETLLTMQAIVNLKAWARVMRGRSGMDSIKIGWISTLIFASNRVFCQLTLLTLIDLM